MAGECVPEGEDDVRVFDEDERDERTRSGGTDKDGSHTGHTDAPILKGQLTCALSIHTPIPGRRSPASHFPPHTYGLLHYP